MFYKNLQEGTVWSAQIISTRIQSKVSFPSIQQVTEHLLTQLLLCLILESHRIDRSGTLGTFYSQKNQPGSPNHCVAEKDEEMLFITGNLISNHFCTIQMIVGKEWCHLHAAHWRTQNWVIPYLQQSTGTWYTVPDLMINKNIYSSFSVWIDAAFICSQKSAQRCCGLDTLTLMK